MADTTQTVEIELKAVDLASSVVKGISKAVGGLVSQVDKITGKLAGIMSRYGGIGAVLSLGASVNSAKKYFDQMVRIRNVAGGTYNEIAGFGRAMEQAGLSAQDFEKTYTSLAMKGAEMRAHVASTTSLARRMGVNFKSPESTLIKMAEKMKDGKLSYDQLNDALGDTGLRLRKFLAQGGPAVAQQLAAARKEMGIINDETMANYVKFKDGIGKIQQAWRRVVVTMGAKLLPILVKLTDGIASRIDSWADSAARFGQLLVDNMETVVGLAKTFAKVMAANYAVMKLTGQGMAAHLGGAIDTTRKKHAASTAGKFPLATAVAAGGLRGRAAGRISGMMAAGGKKGAVGKILAKFFAGVMALAPIVKLLLKLTAVGVVVSLIVRGIQSALSKMTGIKEAITKSFELIVSKIKGISDAFGRIFGENSAIGGFLSSIGGVLLEVFNETLSVVGKILGLVAQLGSVIAIMIESPLLLLDWKKAWKEAGKRSRLAEGKRQYGIKDAMSVRVASRHAEKLLKVQGEGTPADRRIFQRMKKIFASEGLKPKYMAGLEKKFGAKGVPGDRPQIHQDFRGSRFDITQKFAEGFDPDRIATAFAGDLSNFGENKLQSGLAQAFTVR